MQPQQLAGGARKSLDSLAFAEPCRDLLAARDAPPQHPAQAGRGEARRRRIGAEAYALHKASARSAAAVIAAAMRGSAASHPSRGTAMVGPQTTTPRPKGSGSTIRSQLGSTRRRLVCAPAGSTGTPARARELRDPRRGLAARPARAVRRDHHVVAPRQHGKQGQHRDRAALAAGFARIRPRAIDYLDPEPTHHLADEAPVAVTADQHVHARPGVAPAHHDPQHRHQRQALVPERGDAGLPGHDAAPDAPRPRWSNASFAARSRDRGRACGRTESWTTRLRSRRFSIAHGDFACRAVASCPVRGKPAAPRAAPRRPGKPRRRRRAAPHRRRASPRAARPRRPPCRRTGRRAPPPRASRRPSGRR